MLPSRCEGKEWMMIKQCFDRQQGEVVEATRAGGVNYGKRGIYSGGDTIDPGDA